MRLFKKSEQDKHHQAKNIRMSHAETVKDSPMLITSATKVRYLLCQKREELLTLIGILVLSRFSFMNL